MKSKKKLIISLVSIVATLLVVIIASVVAINAAKNQNIASNIDVKYKVSAQVIGYVSATYEYGGVVKDMTTDGKEASLLNNSVWFSYQEKPTTKNLYMQNKDLVEGKLNVLDCYEMILSFKFVNTGYNDFVATGFVSGSAVYNNLKVSYSLDKKTWTEERISVEVDSPIGFETNEVECYIKLEVDNMALDAEFKGTIVWSLEAQDIY